MKQLYYLFILFVALSFLHSCTIINPKENIPVYLQIDSLSVTPTDLVKHGATTHKITDVWVYYDNNIIGTYELPAKIPVINSGDGDILILAGIYENGLSSTRQPYKLYAGHTLKMSKTETGPIIINPSVKYQPELNFSFNADFENGANFIKRSGDTTLIQTSISGEKLNGLYGGKIYLDTAHKFAESITNEAYIISKTSPTYLEIDYKNDIPFTIKGLYTVNGSFQIAEIVSVNTKSEWNKIYINLSSFAVGYNTTQLKLIIEAALPISKQTGTILLDNLKIIAIK